MKRRWIDALWVMGVLLMAGFCLSACNRDLDVQTVFPFEVSTMPVPKQIKQGETVEVRCSLVSEGDFSGTRYTMRFFQTEGKGVLRIGRGVALKPNDRYPVGRGDFRLYYTSRSKERQSLEIVFEDNHGQSQTIVLDFNHKESDEDKRARSRLPCLTAPIIPFLFLINRRRPSERIGAFILFKEFINKTTCPFEHRNERLGRFYTMQR